MLTVGHAIHVVHASVVLEFGAGNKRQGAVVKQNLTVQLETDTIRKAKVLAARRSTSVSRLVADELERLVGEDERYLAAEREALAHLETGFHMGGGKLPSREELHER